MLNLTFFTWASPLDRPGALPNYDHRIAGAAPAAPPSREQAAAREHLRQLLPQVEVEFDRITGSPRSIRSRQGFLSGPHGAGRGISPAAAAMVPAGEAHPAVKAFLHEHRALFGHGPEALSAAKVKREFTSAHNGLKTVVWEQQLDGIPVFEGVLVAHTTRLGELVNVSSQFVPELAAAAERGTPKRKQQEAKPPSSSRKAVKIAAGDVGEKLAEEEIVAVELAAGAEARLQRFQAPGLKGFAEAKLIWLPLSPIEMRLCWEVIFTSKGRGEMFRVLVDAQTGETWLRQCLTRYSSEASYRVFTSDSPTPFSPGHLTPSSNQPPVVARALVTLAALNTNASPSGWIHDRDNETRGNNVDAYTDWDDDDQPDQPRPQGSPWRVFDCPLNLESSPTLSSAAAVVQLFYWCNWMHDKLYDLGFTEAAGNLQQDNFGRGGEGGDALLAEAQDAAGFNNAGISIPPDGQSARLQTFLFSGPSPFRDSALDAEVVLHEYTHALSERSVGGGVGLRAAQSCGLGEGWSDFYALAMLSEAGDDVNGCYASGAYSSYLLGGLAENYYFGIRRYPYSRDVTRNPLTFKDIDPQQATAHAGVPRSPGFGPFDPREVSEVHMQGEVWCVMLWEVRGQLIQKHGFPVGNALVLQVVTDGMRLSPPNPTFVEARDGILLADRVNNGGSNLGELWTAFAKRGLGAGASGSNPWTTEGIREAFDLPDELLVAPDKAVVLRGPAGGPFSPSTQVFALSSARAEPLPWAISQSAGWLDVAPTYGVQLPDGPATLVTCRLDSVTGLMPAGLHTNFIWFTNLATGAAVRRQLVLKIGRADYFTELFLDQDNDVAYQAFTFIPDGSPSLYHLCRQPASQFSVDPLGGHCVLLEDNDKVVVRLSGTHSVSLYGQRTNVIHYTANGYLGPGEGTNVIAPPLADPLVEAHSYQLHFSAPRISALWADFDPSGPVGSVSWQELEDRVAVTYLDVGRYGYPYPDKYHQDNDFQVEWFYDGRIRLTYLNIELEEGLVGLSRGTGLPEDFEESDFTGHSPCGPALLVSLPAEASEGDGILAGQGRVCVPMPAANDVLVRLSCSDSQELLVPATVTIPIGTTNVLFDLTILDDLRLDGARAAVITARADNYEEGTASVAVHDNEAATLSLHLPGYATEGDGEVTGTVSVSAAPDVGIFVKLSSSDETELAVPAYVIIPAGQSSAVFQVRVLDDGELDGDQTVTVTASVPHWSSGSASLTVGDNEARTLEVLAPSDCLEGQGLKRQAGEVRLTGPLPTNLVIRLESTDTTELSVPPTVEVPAGQTAAAFDLTLLDDAEVDGAQTVAVVARATGFVPGECFVTVWDNESPLPPGNPSPPDQAREVPLETALCWQADSEALVNGDFARGDFSGWEYQTSGHGELVLNPAGIVPELNGQPGYSHFRMFFNAWGVGEAVLCQEVAIPADTVAAVLSWNYAVNNPYPCNLATNHGLRVEMRDLQDHLLATAFSTTPTNTTCGTWASCRYDLNSFRGQAVRVAFVVQASGPLSVSLEDLSLKLGQKMTARYAVYFGTNPVPGGAELQGLTNGVSWPLPVLAPQTTYYWQVVGLTGGQTPGPVWQFTTRGVDHFDWAAMASPQAVGQPFRITISAKDERGRLATNYAGTITVAGWNDYHPPLFLENFEDENLDGWTILESGGNESLAEITTNTAAQGRRSLSLAGGGGGGLSNHLAEVQPGQVSFYVRAKTNNADAGYFTFFHTKADTGNFHFARNGTMGLSLHDAWHPVPYEAGRWYKIGVQFDWEQRRMDFYVDDRLVVPAISFKFAGLTLIWLHNQDAAQCWYDEIQLGSGGPGRPIAVSPNRLGPFDQGMWTGELAVLELATNLKLVADDGNGHLGVSAPLVVGPWNDVGLTITPAPAGVVLGQPITFNLLVTNAGPESATGVTVTNALPVHAPVISATASQGTFQIAGNLVVFDVGDLSGRAVARLGVTVQPTETVRVTNVAVLSRQESECCPVNNQAVAIAEVWPSVDVHDVTVSEGNVGVAEIVFPVSLSSPTDRPVPVNFAFSNGTAKVNEDFLASPGTLVFAPGQTSNGIRVQVHGDIQPEADENFYAILSGASNAVLGQAQAMGTLLNEDGRSGEIQDFIWELPLNSPVIAEPFAIRLTARDASGNPATNFHGPVILGAFEETPMSQRLGYYHDWFGLDLGIQNHQVRLQVIYLAEEIGRRGPITSLAFYVPLLPSHPLQNWTIRLKHTLLGHYETNLWEGDNWTTVYQTNLTLSAPGWVNCQFAAPFDYNGVDNLMVDFSYIDLAQVERGCWWISECDQPRTLVLGEYGEFEDPLTWSGSWPPAKARRFRPDLRLDWMGRRTVPMQPATCANFLNGVWAGQVSVAEAGTNFQFVADDLQGHVGTSVPFQVIATNDLALTVVSPPGCARVGEPFSYILVVSNSGPATAGGVVVSNLLSQYVQFASATNTRGDFVLNGSTVIFDVGSLPAQQTASLQLQVRPIVSEILTNFATVTRAGLEVWMTNNTVQSVREVEPPCLGVENAMVVEGNAGFISLSLRVWLSAPLAQPLPISYWTATDPYLPHPASNYEDYLLPYGEFVLPAGTVETNLLVRICSDTLEEPDESFVVVVHPEAALAGECHPNALVTILDDDGTPGLSVGDALIREGDGGTTNAIFPVILSPASGSTVEVSYQTIDGSALAGSDYDGGAGLVRLGPGVTSNCIVVPIHGDTIAEADEVFHVRLYSASNAVIHRDEAQGTILNDDAGPGVAAWFEWSPVAPVQYVGWPLAVALTARDPSGALAAGFNGDTWLQGIKTEFWAPQIGHGDGGQSDFFPMGAAAPVERTQVIYLAPEIGGAGLITKVALEVLEPPGQTLSNWTIQLQATTWDRFPGDIFQEPTWVDEGWSRVCQTNLTVTEPGWVECALNPPFEYDGTNNLLVDFSFQNGFGSHNGRCGQTIRPDGFYLIYRQADGRYGSPLTWHGSIPPPYPESVRPNLRLELTRRTILPVEPACATNFAGGFWSGNLIALSPGTNILLVAWDSQGHTGVSVPLTIEPGADVDTDGLPDAWELRWFGALDAPAGRPDADPDGDQFPNGEEFRAGTNPLDSSSLLRIRDIALLTNQLRFRFESIAGKEYQLEATDSLAHPLWTPVGTPMLGTGQLVEIEFRDAIDQPAQFYRLRLVQ